MKARRAVCLLLALVPGVTGAASLGQQDEAAAGTTLQAAAGELFRASCVRCHGPEKRKAGLRLDELSWDPTDEAGLALWQEVLDRLEAGEMPPEGEPRPEPAILANARAAIRAGFGAIEDAPRERVLRRLSRAQIRNTLRDCLAIDVVLEDPTSTFPPDETLEGFDVLAEGQVMSDFLLSQVLVAARRALDLATFEGPEPEGRTFRMYSEPPGREGNFAVNHTLPEDRPAFLFMNDERAPGDTRGQVLTTSRAGAPVAGWYDFSFMVESAGRANAPAGFHREKHPEWQVFEPDDLLRLEIYLSGPFNESAYTSRQRILVEAIDLPDDERITLERRYWLAPGWRLELAYGNGYPGLLEKYLEHIGARDAVVSTDSLPKPERLGKLAEYTHAAIEHANAPRIVIHEASESGPCYPSWPPPSQIAAYGDPAAPLEERLASFAARAFRRPVEAAELAPYLELARTGPEGLRSALEAILCSPPFLYLIESDGELDDWALAARLSYFLWNTLPDERLRALAAEGRLREPGVLRAEAERMLLDPRVAEFVDAFTWGWLGLQNALDMAPDPMRFPEYYRSRLEPAAVTETRTFFRHVLDQNLPVGELLEADYTFVNADLARLYGVEGVNKTAGFEQVTLPAELWRGGLLGQASVLTASANGVDTSPVVRGVWVLDHLLGTPPDPPPPDVPIPEPDARGALTVREVLDKHRTVESCNECHRSIDPLGFALESFDAIGRRRENYESGAPVDSAGRMPDGTTFEDLRGMKAALLRDLPLFTRNLAGRLASYASGHTLRPADRLEIERIVTRADESGSGLRDLLLAIVDSRLFRRR